MLDLRHHGFLVYLYDYAFFTYFKDFIKFDKEKNLINTKLNIFFYYLYKNTATRKTALNLSRADV